MKYPCNQFDYQATQQGNLKTHIQSKHENIEYACNQCDKKFKWKHLLKSHVQLKH